MKNDFRPRLFSFSFCSSPLRHLPEQFSITLPTSSFFFQGLDSIPCKEVGYILRTLGQNPTEDEIIALVCEAGCDWEGHFTCEDFLNLAYGSVQKQVNRLDDVRAAFK